MARSIPNVDQKLKSENENQKEFKELSVEELKRGYYFSENMKTYTCIFCGERFEEGLIYTIGGRMMAAEKAASVHVEEVHEGSTNQLIALDKQINGLSETQKTLLHCMNARMEIKEISEAMNISAATVRTHKFNLQKSKREARILLAILDNLENGNNPPIIRTAVDTTDTESNRDNSEQIFNLNSLHPFFTQVKYR